MLSPEKVSELSKDLPTLSLEAPNQEAHVTGEGISDDLLQALRDRTERHRRKRSVHEKARIGFYAISMAIALYHSAGGEQAADGIARALHPPEAVSISVAASHHEEGHDRPAPEMDGGMGDVVKAIEERSLEQEVEILPDDLTSI